jgi:hypothetical protein
MRRRQFITLLAGATAWPLAARAQQPQGMRRVGILMPFPKTDSEYEIRVRAFRQELAKLGWTEGGNVQFDERWTTDNMDRVWAEAASLMTSKPDAVMAGGGRVIIRDGRRAVASGGPGRDRQTSAPQGLMQSSDVRFRGKADIASKCRFVRL